MTFQIEATPGSEHRGLDGFVPVEIGDLELTDMQSKDHHGGRNRFTTPPGMKMWIPKESPAAGLRLVDSIDLGTFTSALRMAAKIEVPPGISMRLYNQGDHQEIAINHPGAAAVISHFYTAHDSWMVIHHPWDGKEASVMIEAHEHSYTVLPGADLGSSRTLFHYSEVVIGLPVNPHLHPLEGTMVLSPGATFVTGTEAIHPVTSA